MHNTVVLHLLNENFPPSIHEDICSAAGLDLPLPIELSATVGRVRGRAFRDLVLIAYESRCAVCGFRGQIGSMFTGLDAAHVRWWAAGGPDVVDNGLCLCSLHHKLLDSGAIGVSAEHRLLVSARFIGDDVAAQALVIQRSGTPLLRPQTGQPEVDERNLAWHRREVFKGPAREDNLN
jgi:putative restriction endonuclease